MILITGATDGIGQQTALELARLGHRIIILGRNTTRIRNTIDRIRKETGHKDLYELQADFASLQQVADAADKVKQQFPELRILINNAGVYMPNFQTSHDGYEMTFAVNFLSHFLLTNKLLPILQKQHDARIINVSSLTHTWAKPDFDNLNAEKGYDAQNAYALSKLLNLMFSHELHRRFFPEICSNALHPGVIATKLLHAGWSGGDKVETGALTSVFLAHSAPNQIQCGKYWSDKRVSKESEYANNKELCSKLWQIAEKMVQEYL